MEAFIFEVETQMGYGESMTSRYHVSASSQYEAQVLLKAQLDLKPDDKIRMLRVLSDREIEDIGLSKGELRLVK